MLLEVFRRKSNGDTTIGDMHVDGQYLCKTLEDEYRDVKIMAETRIPAGTYIIKLQHQGMLWLQNVPNFTTIYIHIGNTDEDTRGCILVGMLEKDWKLIQSTVAYVKLYTKVTQALNNGEPVSITIYDEG